MYNVRSVVIETIYWNHFTHPRSNLTYKHIYLLFVKDGFYHDDRV